MSRRILMNINALKEHFMDKQNQPLWFWCWLEVG